MKSANRGIQGGGVYTLATLMLFLAAGSVRAEMNCSHTHGHGPLSVVRPLQYETMTVAPNSPLGTVVSFQKFVGLPIAQLRCSGGGDDRIQEQYRLSIVPQLSDWQPSDNSAGHVYASGVPGIGYSIRYYRGDSTNVPTSYNYLRLSNNTTGFAPETFDRTVTTNPVDIDGLTSDVEVIFIKTGNIVPGEISGASLPMLRWIFGRLPLYNLSFVGTMNVVPQTCTTPSEVVALDPALAGEFSGPGSGGPPVSFNIHLRSCPALSQDDEGAAPAIRYQIMPLPTNILAPGVLKPSPARPLDVGAKGIGIELRPGRSGQSVLPFNAWMTNFESSPQEPYDTWSIPLAARYVQTTAGKVDPGQADGAVEFVIDYR